LATIITYLLTIPFSLDLPTTPNENLKLTIAYYFLLIVRIRLSTARVIPLKVLSSANLALRAAFLVAFLAAISSLRSFCC
jgi:hypothetical protein